ncbi:hypothetical protein [Prosthecobacter sp.]|uniref:hypothetical protein n=1 Tax=Prosthecobacter sp. TaxID=1965333 RepID=UPI0037837553
MEILKLEKSPEFGDTHPNNPDYELIGYKSRQINRHVTGTATWRNLRLWPEAKDIVQGFIIPGREGNELSHESPEPPELIFLEHTDAQSRKFVGLGGWDQFFGFAMHNDAAFLTAVNRAKMEGLNEMDTLRLIAASMTHKAWNVQRMAIEQLKLNGIPFNTVHLATLEKEERERDAGYRNRPNENGGVTEIKK